MPGQGHTIQVSGDKGKDVTFTVSGRVALDNLESFISETQTRLQEMIPARLTVDLAGVELPGQRRGSGPDGTGKQRPGPVGDL